MISNKHKFIILFIIALSAFIVLTDNYDHFDHHSGYQCTRLVFYYLMAAVNIASCVIIFNSKNIKTVSVSALINFLIVFAAIKINDRDFYGLAPINLKDSTQTLGIYLNAASLAVLAWAASRLPDKPAQD